MKTIFEATVREQLIARIESLSEHNTREWGKMTAIQMLRHNTYWNEWILGKGTHSYRQSFMGKVFGGIALKRMIKDEKPFDKNIPTSKQFKPAASTGDLSSEKQKWISLIREYEEYHHPDFIHDFFGKMTRDQIGILVYKHTDHHLRQFGA